MIIPIVLRSISNDIPRLYIFKWSLHLHPDTTPTQQHKTTNTKKAYHVVKCLLLSEIVLSSKNRRNAPIFSSQIASVFATSPTKLALFANSPVPVNKWTVSAPATTYFAAPVSIHIACIKSI